MGSHKHAHFVGSVNLDSVDEVWTTALDTVGDRLLRVPDGEPGPRRLWISYQYPMFLQSRYLMPGPEDAAETPQKPVCVIPGIDPGEIRFPELGYAREARTSYRDFCALRDAGQITSGMRFQVCLPTPYACVSAWVVRDDQAKVEPAYEAAMLREVETIVGSIPHDDLAIQWDVCVEMIVYDGRLWPAPWIPDAFAARFKRLADAVPEGVELGFHLCYGDFGNRHFIEPQDAAKMVGLANEISATVDRSIAWIHMPVPIDRSDDPYFAPLIDLKLHPETELFLGLVHLKDGVEGTSKRIATAEKYVADFGVATECGMGRSYDPSDIESLMTIHAAVCTD